LVTVSELITPAPQASSDAQEEPVEQGSRPTYQLQHRRCGKAYCRTCREGPGHGPYWYSFSRGSDGRLRSRYVGKVLPPRAVLSPRQRARMQALSLSPLASPSGPNVSSFAGAQDEMLALRTTYGRQDVTERSECRGSLMISRSAQNIAERSEYRRALRMT